MRGERVGPAGLATRDAVRRVLRDRDDPKAVGELDQARDLGKLRMVGERSGPVVLVGCSGGPDSLALAAATAFVAPRLGLRAGAVIVDHGLQTGSADVAARAEQTCCELGLDPVDVVRVTVEASPDGPEAAARRARYAALEAAADRHGAEMVLLGHTRDDQAESVLLGLLRGSGARSLAGMPARRGRFVRPFLPLARTSTLAACAELGLAAWTDPHNADPAYARPRARALVSELEQRVGSGATAGLARTAELLRADDEALEHWAAHEYSASVTGGHAPGPVAVDCERIAGLPGAIRSRVLRRAALVAGARSADLSSTHLSALDALVMSWRGQGPVDLPGPVRGVRECGRLLLADPDRAVSPERTATPSEE